MQRTNNQKIKEIIGKTAEACGLYSFGFCSFLSLKDNLLPWSALKRIPENARGVIVAAFPYLLTDKDYDGCNISKYAVVKDYHLIAGGILKRFSEKLRNEFEGEEFEPFVDSSPVPEVYAACLAGVGIKGMNGLLITEKYGSWVFLGEIVTTLEFADAQSEVRTCIKCGACKLKCPSGAIGENGVERDRCMSHITQKKGELTKEEVALIKSNACAWGCDVCQNVCPYNANAQKTYIEDFYRDSLSRADAEILDGRAYAWRGKKVIERNLKILNNSEE